MFRWTLAAASVAIGAVLLVLAFRDAPPTEAAGSARHLREPVAPPGAAADHPPRGVSALETEPAPPQVVRQRPSADSQDSGAANQRRYSVRLNELSTFCWGDPANPSQPYADEPIDMFAIRIPTRAGTATPFDFCIEQVRFGDAALVWGDDGRVDGSANRLGLSGAWLTFSDEVTSWERPRAGQSFRGDVKAGAPICVKGTAPEVFEGHYGDYWGAAVGFKFHRADSAAERPRPYRPRFTTIDVTLSGASIPDVLTFAVDRRAFREGNDSWCKFVRAGAE